MAKSSLSNFYLEQVHDQQSAALFTNFHFQILTLKFALTLRVQQVSCNTKFAMLLVLASISFANDPQCSSFAFSQFFLNRMK